MFTLKLYQNGGTLCGRTVIMECVGVWSDICAGDVRHVHAFKKTVGVMDEDGPSDFYVGGSPPPGMMQSQQAPDVQTECLLPPAIVRGIGGNYFDWGVLENAQGKTTEMFR